MQNLLVQVYMNQMMDKELQIDSKEFDKHISINDMLYLIKRVKNYILDDHTRKNEIVTFTIGKKDFTFKINQFLIQLIFLEPNIRYSVPITEEFIVIFNEGFINNINKYIEMVGKKFEKLLIDMDKIDELSFIFANINTHLVQLAEDFSPISSPTFDIFDIIDFYERNSKFRSLLDTKLDESKSFRDLEQELEDKGREFKQTVLDDKDNCLSSFMSVNRLNVTQSTQMFIAVGPRATTSNVVIPHVIKESYLKGLQCPADMISEAEVTRKSLINKKKHVGESGYLSRETDLLAQRTNIDYSVKDCKTKHYLDFEVKTKDHLSMIINKNMITDSKGSFRCITSEDTDLIGTKIKLRSYISCAIRERGKICMNCYGATSELKKSTVIGGLASIKTLNPVSNMLMATKHKSSTRTMEFDNEETLKYFNREDSGLILKQLPEEYLNVSIAFDKEYIEDIIERGGDEDSTDDDSTMSMKMLSSLKYIYRTKDPETFEDLEEEKRIFIDNSYLTLSDEILENMSIFEMSVESDEAILHLKNIKPGTCVFDIIYITEETSKYLKQIKRIMSKPKTEAFTEYNTPTQDLCDLLIDAGLDNGKVELTHIESIIYNFIRDSNDVLIRPDFTRPDPNITILNLETAIFKGDLFTGLVFQEVSSQLIDTDSYRKHGEGIHDAQFRVTKKFNYDYLTRELNKKKREGLVKFRERV